MGWSLRLPTSYDAWSAALELHSQHHQQQRPEHQQQTHLQQQQYAQGAGSSERAPEVTALRTARELLSAEERRGGEDSPESSPGFALHASSPNSQLVRKGASEELQVALQAATSSTSAGVEGGGSMEQIAALRQCGGNGVVPEAASCIEHSRRPTQLSVPLVAGGRFVSAPPPAAVAQFSTAAPPALASPPRLLPPMLPAASLTGAAPSSPVLEGGDPHSAGEHRQPQVSFQSAAGRSLAVSHSAVRRAEELLNVEPALPNVRSDRPMEEDGEPSLLGPQARAPFRAPRTAAAPAGAGAAPAALSNAGGAAIAGESLLGPSARKQFKRPRVSTG